MSEAPPNSPKEGAVSPNRTARTVAFIAVVGGVLAVFAFLGTQDRPPRMPSSPPHTLRFRITGEFVGVDGEPGLEEALKPGTEIDKKAVETRVNTGCQACHGAPSIDLTNHPCQALHKCVPPTHPPKTECIKCHRMPPPPPATVTPPTTP